LEYKEPFNIKNNAGKLSIDFLPKTSIIRLHELDATITWPTEHLLSIDKYAKSQEEYLTEDVSTKITVGDFSFNKKIKVTVKHNKEKYREIFADYNKLRSQEFPKLDSSESDDNIILISKTGIKTFNLPKQTSGGVPIAWSVMNMEYRIDPATRQVDEKHCNYQITSEELKIIVAELPSGDDPVSLYVKASMEVGSGENVFIRRRIFRFIMREYDED
jgi:hypothetical protein